MKFIKSVVTTSSTPNRRRSSAGPANNTAPAAMLATISSATARGAGSPLIMLCPSPAVTSAPM